MNNTMGEVLRDGIVYGARPGSAPGGASPSVRVRGWVGDAGDCPSLNGGGSERPAGAVPRRIHDDGGRLVAISSSGDQLGP